MPVTTSASDALRKDRRRTLTNLRRKRTAKKEVDDFKAKPAAKSLNTAVSQIDRLVKHHLIHANKAARLKSALHKLLVKKAH